MSHCAWERMPTLPETQRVLWADPFIESYNRVSLLWGGPRLPRMDMATTHRRHAEPQKAPQRMPKADRESQLLAQAKHLFVTLRYHCTTTQKIAQPASVGEPVLYRHFDSTKALFLEAIGRIQ